MPRPDARSAESRLEDALALQIVWGGCLRNRGNRSLGTDPGVPVWRADLDLPILWVLLILLVLLICLILLIRRIAAERPRGLRTVSRRSRRGVAVG